MADPPPDPDSYPDTGVRPGHGSTTGAPRWVKVFGIIALVLVLLVVVLLLAGGGPGSHGPGRHTGGQTPFSSVIESGGVGGHKPPAAGHQA